MVRKKDPGGFLALELLFHVLGSDGYKEKGISFSGFLERGRWWSFCFGLIVLHRDTFLIILFSKRR